MISFNVILNRENQGMMVNLDHQVQQGLPDQEDFRECLVYRVRKDTEDSQVLMEPKESKVCLERKVWED